MKKLFLTAFFVLPFYLINAQPIISISGGVKLIGAKNQTTTLWYVDESPSRDNIYKDIGQIGKVALNLNVRWINRKPDNFWLFLEGQGYIGSISGLAFNGGLIYNGNKSGKVKIQPEISGVLGYCSKWIGAIENNDVYIQVNQTRFQDYSNVFVSLENAYIGIKPGLSFVFKTKNDKEIGLGVNYQLSIKAGYVSFSGTGQEGNQVSDSESLTASNVGFYVDGDKSNTNPYNPDGLEFKVIYNF